MLDLGPIGQLPTREKEIPRLPKRPIDANKGLFGAVLIVAGGRGMAGAAGLSGAACLRSGAGKVRIASPREVQPTVASFEPSYMTHPLAENDGLVDFPACQADLERLIAEATVLAVGPGLGRSKRLDEFVRWVVEDVQIPTVIDADALNSLSEQIDILDRARRPLILTPHPGEFARLTGRTVAEVQADRETLAVGFARKYKNVTLILKGAQTVVTDGERLAINGTGNPGMAKGGSGDVLTGILAALLAQKLAPFAAARLGAHAHGFAGDIAKDQNGELGMIAGDIVDALADAFDLLAQE